MKRFYNILLICVALFALSSCVSDGKVNDLQGGNTPSEEKGVLTINVGTRSESGATHDYILSIFKNEGGKSTLVRKFNSSKEDMQKPEYIWLLTGNYTAKVECGTAIAATFNEAEQYFYGEESFDITAGETKTVDLVAVMQNIPVEVVFDQTIIEGFLAGYNVEVKADNSAKLTYTESKTGYLIMPNGVTALSWDFVGTFKYDDNGEEVQVNKSGTIEDVELKRAYKLSFKFSKDASGFLGGDLSVILDESIEERDDHLTFSPDPELKGVGFDLAAPHNYTSGERQYLATAPSVFNNVVITVGDKVFEPTIDDIPGITLKGLNSAQLYITLSDDFFNSLSGGNQIINMRVFDIDGGSVAKDLPYNLQGVKALDSSSINLWGGVASVSASVFGSPSSVEIICREGDGEWSHYTAAANENNTYTAQVDVRAGRTYEYNLVINDKTIGTSLAFTTEQGAQIPNGDMEQWCTSGKVAIPFYTADNAYWCSGNWGTASWGGNITNESSDVRPGSIGKKSAYMASKYVVVKFAAGNMFVGSWGGMSTGTNAIVNFGQPFSYNARPKGIKMWIRYNCGTIDNRGESGGAKGEPDLTKIFCCMCNWSGPHGVDSAKPAATTFNPSMEDIKNCTDERYDGVLYTAYFESRTSNNEWHELYIPFEKVEGIDESVVPNYLVLTTSCSGYGDYFTGSTDSWMYVDDIEFVY